MHDTWSQPTTRNERLTHTHAHTHTRTCAHLRFLVGLQPLHGICDSDVVDVDDAFAVAGEQRAASVVDAAEGASERVQAADGGNVSMPVCGRQSGVEIDDLARPIGQQARSGGQPNTLAT